MEPPQRLLIHFIQFKMKSILSTLAVCAFAAAASAQTITLTFGVGVLADSSGTPLSDGRLIQVIASPDTIFGAPDELSFVTGNDVLLYSGGFDSSLFGVEGITSFAAVVDLAQAPVVGYNLAIRWFPTLTEQALSPGFATFYGEYGFNQDSSWVAPAAGNTISLEMLTQSTTIGNVPDVLGYAVQQTPIPEPSTYAAIFGALALGFVAYRRRLANAA